MNVTHRRIQELLGLNTPYLIEKVMKTRREKNPTTLNIDEAFDPSLATSGS
jgi:hypothetical protein